MIDFSGKKFLVLGASSDIGISLVQSIISLNGSVVAQGNKRVDKLSADVDSIRYEFTEGNIEQFVSLLNGQTFDGFVNLIGKTGFCYTKHLKHEHVHDILFLNLTLNIYFSTFLHQLLNKNASVVFVNSAVADIGENGMVHYGMANSGITGLVRGLAKELSHVSCRVNAVKPHLIETENTRSIPDKIKANYIQTNLMKRLGKPEDVSNAILFLLSNLSSYITGQEIKVNGGSYLS